MRVPISWLRDFVDIDLSPDDLAELITNAGMEVTTIERIGVTGAEFEWSREHVVLARVLEVERHPNADRLVIATVDGGAGERRVVTGAGNLFPFIDDATLRERQVMSPLLLEGGAYLDAHKDGKRTKLKGKEIRGVYNDAMLCSEVELGLGEDHDGIMLFEADELLGESTPGTPLVEVLGDAILDIDIIPNIARCASILGIAREVAALTRTALEEPSYDVLMEGGDLGGRVEITTENPELNPRFVALLIEGVEQKPSPLWMRHRLALAGQRPINVVVDISNYVMLEMGQPNHTFDFHFLRKRAEEYAPDGPIQIITRLAEPEETLTTLDGAVHELKPNNILVTDPNGNLSLGGVMGGLDSEIQPETTNVLLEAAAWNFINIRQTSRQLGLNTEAGFRFSRGVHPSQALLGAKRAAELLRQLAGGTVANGIIDTYSRPPEPVTIDLATSYVNQRSGLELESGQIADCLRRLQFEVEDPGQGQLRVTVPDHRIDVEGKHDLLEEVCRMIGYDQLPTTVLRDTLPPQRGNPRLEREERVRDLLVQQGLNEVITYRLTTPEAEARLSDTVSSDPYIEITNPSTRERSHMRHSLLASVLEIAAANSRFQSRLGLFEVGSVFIPNSETGLADEPAHVAVVLAGDRSIGAWDQPDSRPVDFYDLKGIIDSLLGTLKIEVTLCAAEVDGLRPGRTAELRANGDVVGHLGELHPLAIERYDFRLERGRTVVIADLDLERVLDLLPERYEVEPVPTFPAVREDLALLVASATEAQAVEGSLRKAGGKLLADVELFDVYEGDRLESGQKSLAYHLTFQAPNRTLTDKDVQKQRQRLLRAVERDVGATLRDG